MSITISARLGHQQKSSIEPKQQLVRQKLISGKLMLVMMGYSEYVQYASEMSENENIRNDTISP